MSESGKSTVGRYLESRGIKRLKIADFMGEVHRKFGGNIDYHTWIWQVENDRPEWLYAKFLKHLKNFLAENSTGWCSIESLYNPALGTYLRQRLGSDCRIIYVDLPPDLRIKRQMERRNLPSLNEARTYLVPRDEFKERIGVPKIREIADVVIDNSGTEKELYKKLDAILSEWDYDDETK